MNVKIADLMVEKVVTAQPHRTIDRVRAQMERNQVHAIPVVDSEGQPVGVVSSADLVPVLKGGTPVSKVMSEKVYQVSQYDDVHIAARVMRNHGIHHVLVTHEQKLVGILSSFDLLKLVEEHRFVMKGAPTASKRKGTKRM